MQQVAGVGLAPVPVLDHGFCLIPGLNKGSLGVLAAPRCVLIWHGKHVHLLLLIVAGAIPAILMEVLLVNQVDETLLVGQVGAWLLIGRKRSEERHGFGLLIVIQYCTIKSVRFIVIAIQY